MFNALRPERGTLNWRDQYETQRCRRVIDPDGDPVSITVDSIFQDEPVFFAPDGRGVGTDTASVRAWRLSGRWIHRFSQTRSNGRVYHIGFTAEDNRRGTCSGEVVVKVPRRSRIEAIDDGPRFDPTVLSPR